MKFDPKHSSFAVGSGAFSDWLLLLAVSLAVGAARAPPCRPFNLLIFLFGFKQSSGVAGACTLGWYLANIRLFQHGFQHSFIVESRMPFPQTIRWQILAIGQWNWFLFDSRKPLRIRWQHSINSFRKKIKFHKELLKVRALVLIRATTWSACATWFMNMI